jgi:phosphoglycerate dehydrogenase-like enzyme
MTVLGQVREVWVFPVKSMSGARVDEARVEPGGLVGFGAVPSLLAPVLRALGARVLYTARSPKHTAEAEYRELDTLLAEADIVSLHVPLTTATSGLLNARRLAAMRPGAVLINTARGALVDEAALLDHLERGHLAGAGLDVFVDEPLPADHPLLRRPEVVLAPHVAWLTGETLSRSLEVAVENCRRLAAGEPLLHRVDHPGPGGTSV